MQSGADNPPPSSLTEIRQPMYA